MNDNKPDKQKDKAFLSEENYLIKEIQQVAELGYYVTDFKLKRWQSSSKLDEIFGIGPDYIRSIEGWINLVDPSMKEEMAEYLEEIMEKSIPFNKEYRIINQINGQVRWVYGRGKLEFDEKGNVIKMLGTIQDITERKKNEFDLGRFKFFTDNSEQAQGLAEESGKIIYINSAMEKLLGYSREEIYKFNAEELDIFLQDKSFKKLVYEVIQGNQHHIEENIVRKDKSVFPAEIFISLHQIDGVIYGYYTLQDITSRKLAEEVQFKLQEEISSRNKRMEQLINTIPIGIILITEQGKLLGVNPLGKKHMMILTDNFKTNKKISHIGKLPLETILNHGRSENNKWQSLVSGSRSYEILAHLAGDYMDESYWAIVIRDITEEQEIHLRLKQQDRLAVVGQLAAGISHDFNNIMAVIKLYAQIGMRKKGIPPDMKDALGIILDQAGAANRLTEQVMDFSRRPVMEPRPLNLVIFFKEVIKLLQRTIPESIRINFNYGLGDFIIKADPTAMQQIVMNLALNARNAMPEGGLLDFNLSVTDEGREIRCLFCRKLIKGSWIMLKIEDNGIGIPPKIFPHIFEPFFTTGETSISTGLGLSQVLGIVKHHKGHIDVETSPGKGTTFMIYLPIYKNEQAEAELQVSEQPVMGNNEKILVVVKNDILRKALIANLNSLEYRTIEARSGNEALRIIHHSFLLGDNDSDSKISLVLCDEILSGLKGKDLFAEIKQQYPKLPLILIGEKAVIDNLESLKNSGLDGWLPSPDNLVNLPDIIQVVLKKNRDN